VGQEGVALTVLRPAGTGEFAGRRLDIVTDGDSLSAARKSKLSAQKAAGIVVEPVE